jgi:Glycosyltransferase family 87
MAANDEAAVGTAPPREEEKREQRRRLVVRLLMGGAPVLFAAGFVGLAAAHGKFAANFELTFWPAGRDVLDGLSPFPPVTREALAPGMGFVYPAPAALLMVPFALLPLHVAAILFTILLAACAVLALYAVGVRDWRCYSVVFLWFPVLSELQKANLTLLLALGAALVWRFRDRAVLAGIAAGGFVSLKLLLWPLVVWLLATRRFAAGLWALAAGTAFTFGSWAVLGFAGIGDYIPTVRLLSKIEKDASYTPYAVGLLLGLEPNVAQALGLLIAAAVLGGAVVLGWKGDERRAFVLALAACVLFSPIVWLHYFALFVVALGLLEPHFGWIWLLPVLAIGAPRPGGPSWWAVANLAFWALVLAVTLRRSTREHPRAGSPGSTRPDRVRIRRRPGTAAAGG